MKQFVYAPQDAGLAEWPSGTLRLGGIEVTENPDGAAVFVCPGSIRIFERSCGVLDMAKLSRLPYFNGRESRHVFFDVSDNFTRALNLPIIFIRCDVRKWMLPHDVNTIQVAWPVEDYSECIDVPAGGFKYAVSFHGWLSTETRGLAAEACKNDSRFESDVAMYSDFTGYIYDTPEGIRRRREFRRSMKESRIALCPESIPGVLPYRFFEAMSAGRVPLLVGSDYVLPFGEEIDYSAFTLFCERDAAKDANRIAMEFCGKTSDAEFIERGKLARQAWEKWLDRDKWPSLMAYAVRKSLRVPA